MSRIKITLPASFSFKTSIPIRITDLNYGNHVGNDTILSLVHEARVQFLKHHGLAEMEFAGTSLIMSDAVIEFKSELFYGGTLVAEVAASNFSRAGFHLYYRLTQDDKVIALASTGMVCFNYDTRKVSALPDAAKKKLEG